MDTSTARSLWLVLLLPTLAAPLPAAGQLVGGNWPMRIPEGTSRETADSLQPTVDAYNDECDPSTWPSPADAPQICRQEPAKGDDPEQFESTCPIQPKTPGWTRICVPTVLAGDHKVKNLIISPPYGMLIATHGGLGSPTVPSLTVEEDLLGFGGSFQMPFGAILGGNLDIVAEGEFMVGLGAIALLGDLHVDSPKVVLGEAHDPVDGIPVYDVPVPGLGVVWANDRVTVRSEKIEVKEGCTLHGGILDVEAKSLVVSPGGHVSADGGGGKGTPEEGAPAASWGGSYGGYGGAPDAYCPNCYSDYMGGTFWNTARAPTFGDPTRPDAPGRGGGPAWGDPGGAGGGFIRMKLDTLELQGGASAWAVVSADGEAPLRGNVWHSGGGGGSGGGIDVTVKTLKGSGLIRADGAGPCSTLVDPPSCAEQGEGGGGGGGRIAIRYEQRDAWSGAVTAHGATMGPRLLAEETNMYLTYGRGKSGGAGTVYWKQAAEADAAGELVIAGPAVDPATWPGGMDAYTMVIQGWGATDLSPAFSSTSRKLVVSGAAFATVSGSALVFQSLAVSGGAVLGLDGCDDPWGCEAGHALAVTGDAITIGAGSRLDLTGRGGPGAADPGDDEVPLARRDGTAPTSTSAAGTPVAGATSFAGGSHGGEGAPSLLLHAEGRPNAAYGSAIDPRDWGRGGGGGPYENTYGMPGGGLLTISARSLTVHGLVSVNGATTPYDVSQGGGGAGGGLNVKVDRLAGGGALEANGGTGCPPPPDLSLECLDEVGGSGGGGRIAIVSGDRSGWTGTVRARGGRVWTADPVDLRERLTGMSGGAGTVFWRSAASPASAGTLLVDNGSGDPTMWTPGADAWQIGMGRWAATPLDAEALTTDRTLEVRGSATFVASRSSDLAMRSLVLQEGAILGLPRCEQAWGCEGPHALRVAATDVEVGAAARIDLTGRGGWSVEDPGLAAPALAAASGQLIPGSTGPSGGSYGGLGASIEEGATPNPIFGDPDAPADHGRAGGPGRSGLGYPGGGFLSIRAQNLTLAGTLATVGAPGSGGPDGFAGELSAVWPGGGGSGGGIVLDAKTFRGSGAVLAGGAQVVDRINCYAFAPGGGGRVLVKASDRSGWTGVADASGGTCRDQGVVGVAGGAGTVRWGTTPTAPSGSGGGGGCASGGAGQGSAALVLVSVLLLIRRARREEA